MPSEDLTDLHIVVVGINFWPEHAGIAPYTSALCEHLRALGARLSVIAGVPHYPAWTTPAAYRRRLRVHDEVHGVAVRRLRHYVPRRSSAWERSLYELTFGAHVAVQRVSDRADLVVAVVPSLAGAAGAYRLAASHNAPLVLWIQDLMGAAVIQSGILGGRFVARLTQRLEGAVLARAEATVVISQAFEQYVRERGTAADTVHCVPNWSHVSFPTGDREATRRAYGWLPDEMIVLHSGNMGLKQGLNSVIDAAALASQRSLPLRFVLMGDGNQRRTLERQAEKVGAIEFRPPAGDDEFTSVLAAADVLLVTERPSVVNMSLPSKLTSYLLAGRPIVAAVPENGATHHLVLSTGAGLCAPPEDPERLLEAIQQVAADDDPAHFAAAGLRYAEAHLGSEQALGRLTDLLAVVSRSGCPRSPSRSERSPNRSGRTR